MEIALSLRKLWSLRPWVIVVAIVALLGSVILTENVSLFPPSVEAEQGIEFGAASTSLLVDSSGSAIGDLRRPLEPLTARAAVVAMLIRSEPVQLQISKTTGIAPGTIATSVTIPNPQNPNQPPNQSAGEQASALVGQSAAYQIAVAPVPEVPIINIATQAPTGKGAIALARATIAAVGNYLGVIQQDGAVPTLSRVKLRTLGRVSGGNVNSGASRSVTVLAFFAIFIVGCLVILGGSRIAEDIRISQELEQEMQGGAESAQDPAKPPDGGPPNHSPEEPSQPVSSAFDWGPRPPLD